MTSTFSSTSDTGGVSRRDLLEAGALAAAVAAVSVTVAARTVEAANALPPDSLTPVPLPQQAPAKEGHAQLSFGKLWYWDTGGNGQPVVFLHPNSGSALVWSYQQPAFAKAGYRAIGYSRRNFYNSDPVPKENPGIASQDLHELIEFLKLPKVHLVASAAGGSIIMDYYLSHPEKVLSLTISSNSAGVRKGAIVEAAQSIRPHIWEEIPVEYRELGPSYRGANQDGFKKWVELNRKSRNGDVAQKTANSIEDQTLEKVKVPTLLITGDADMSTPPSIMRMVQKRIPNSEMVIVPESGHSVYWEQPELFNRVVLEFIGRHKS